MPVALVNARLSARSLARRAASAACCSEAAQGIACVAAQTEADAERLRQAGASRGSHRQHQVRRPPDTGDVDAGAAMHGRFGKRPVLLCASTREGEEAMILDALVRWRRRWARRWW